jgi:hypothetical protein
MHWKKALTICFLCALCLPLAAQRTRSRTVKSTYTQKRFTNAARVRGAKAKVVCPIFEHSKYPYHGIGFKLGDPFAITYKYYGSSKFSVAVDVGRPASSLYSRYYGGKFDEYVVRDTFSTSEAFIVPITHKVISDIMVDAKVLYSVDVEKISTGLQVYVGVGWEWKRTNLQYDYTYSLGQFNSVDTFGRFKRSRVTMGPQVAVGIEYSYFSIPISAFMELEYFTDIQADPGWTRLEGGVGLRYVF